MQGAEEVPSLFLPLSPLCTCLPFLPPAGGKNGRHVHNGYNVNNGVNVVNVVYVVYVVYVPPVFASRREAT